MTTTAITLAVIALTAGPNPQTRMRNFFDAIRQVETGGKPNGGRDAVGTAGEIGPYQIMRAYWIDSGVPGSYEQVRDKAYAEKVMLAYWKRYCSTALRNLDFEKLARHHNGGPTLWKSEAAGRYWQRVERKLMKAR